MVRMNNCITNEDVLCSLIRTSFGSDETVSILDDVDWKSVVDLSMEQGVSAIACNGLHRLYETNPKMTLSIDLPENKDVKFEWFSNTMRVEKYNQLVSSQAVKLTKMFAKNGFRSCVLKGQGLGLLYPDPLLRQSGDIDIWVEGGREKVLAFLRKHWKVSHIVNHHAEVKFFHETSVEVHYMPAWVYNPVNDVKLQKYFAHEADAQFSNMTEAGFAMPTIGFNLVFVAIHIYKHFYQEGILLKQIVDYYYVLKASTSDERISAFKFLSELGLENFVANLMFVMKIKLGLEDEYLLCTPRESSHRPLGELICLYPWKLCHLGWRLYKGYL